MKGLLFACRVAFILNLMFILSMLARWGVVNISNQYAVGFVVTSGLVLALLVNVVLNTILIVRVLRGIRNTGIPSWLINANFIILIFQIIFYFIR